MYAQFFKNLKFYMVILSILYLLNSSSAFKIENIRVERQLDEDEETTIKGPGYEGILNGLGGIFSNLVKGNANGIIESSFNFVAPVHKNKISEAYGAIVGRTTTLPPTQKTTSKPVKKVQISTTEDSGNEEEVDEAPNKIQQGASVLVKNANRPRPNIKQSTGDDEEDEYLNVLKSPSLQKISNKNIESRPVSAPVSNAEDEDIEDDSETQI